MNANANRPLWTVELVAGPDDQRRLFRRISDDVAALILDGTLPAGFRLPSARELAAIYGVSTMTAQRAMNELRQCRFTYGIAGKGTFVHPEARTVAVLMQAMRNHRVARDVAEYLRHHQNLAATEIETTGKRQRRNTSCALLEHALGYQPLLEYLQQLWLRWPDPPEPEHTQLHLF